MTTLPSVINLGPIVLVSLKIVLLILLTFYAVFALLVAKKVSFLSKILETEVSPLLTYAAVFNFLFSITLFLVTALWL